MAKPNFNLSGVLGNTKSDDTHSKDTQYQDDYVPQIQVKVEEKKVPKFEKNEIKSDTTKKCLLQIPSSQHRMLKMFCAMNDMKVSDFILEAIKEKLERKN
jgi:hypothetical protein